MIRINRHVIFKNFAPFIQIEKAKKNLDIVMLMYNLLKNKIILKIRSFITTL